MQVLIRAAPKQNSHRKGGYFVLVVEAGGIEPPSASDPPSGSTCLVYCKFHPPRPNRQENDELSLLKFNVRLTGAASRGPV